MNLAFILFLLLSAGSPVKTILLAAGCLAIALLVVTFATGTLGGIIAGIKAGLKDGDKKQD